MESFEIASSGERQYEYFSTLVKIAIVYLNSNQSSNDVNADCKNNRIKHKAENAMN